MNTVLDFMKKFPDDNACLDHLMATRYGETTKCPKCEKESKFSRITNQPAYVCSWCGHHIHPMSGTIFQDSKTPLQKWFYAMYLFTTSRHGVPAKEIQRQISVTYKTAWRMADQIRQYMGEVDGDENLQGHVEVDETYIGGKHPGKRGRGASGKTVVFGMVQRGGDVMTRVVPNVRRKTLQPIIDEKIAQGSTISTDELPTYNKIGEHGFNHGVVNHGKGQYVKGPHSVNAVEGFWSQVKRSIKGTHVHVSRKHMSKYLGEFEFRYNMRLTPSLMFDRLLRAF